MANIEKRGNSYRIVVSGGFDVNGKRIKQSMTYKPPEGLSPTKLKKEVEKVAREFEEKCNLGYVMDSNIKLIDFIELWFKNYVGNKNLSPVTVRGYQNESVKIIEELGHLKIGEITPKHVQDFYAKVKSGTGMRGGEKFKATPEYLKIVATMKQKQISEKASINDDALRRIKKGGNTNRDIAEKIAVAIGENFDNLFISTNPGKEVSNDTVLHYHKLLNNIMNTAVKWGVIAFNPIEKRVELPNQSVKNRLIWMIKKL
ncbi:MAG: integrase [Eubacteriaceae bacterium]|nr:integrase [Eubacteriaceae bacterium]